MTKRIYNRFDKSLISGLPRAEFPGKIHVIVSINVCNEVVNKLMKADILGIDTETRPSFRKGVLNQVSLLQVSTHDDCYLFRLCRLGLPKSIITLLSDNTVPKVGLSLHDDLMQLRRRGKFTPGLFIDLQDHMREIGIQDLSLQKLYANIFGEKISKSAQLSNWDADHLSPKQVMYAATDAWACIQLYDELSRLRTTGDYELVGDTVSDLTNDNQEP